MKKRTKIILGTAGGLCALIAVIPSSPEEAGPESIHVPLPHGGAVVVEVDETPVPDLPTTTTAPTTTTTAPEPALLDADILPIALGIVWNDTPAEDQAVLCQLWASVSDAEFIEIARGPLDPGSIAAQYEGVTGDDVLQAYVDMLWEECTLSGEASAPAAPAVRDTPAAEEAVVDQVSLPPADLVDCGWYTFSSGVDTPASEHECGDQSDTVACYGVSPTDGAATRGVMSRSSIVGPLPDNCEVIG